MKNPVKRNGLIGDYPSGFSSGTKTGIKAFLFVCFSLLLLQSAVAAPTITVQPVSSRTVCSGTSVAFSITASGTGLTYQWKKAGTAISGATSATYTIASVLTSHAGNYTCTVTNSTGSTTSSTSALAVNATPAAPGVTSPVNYCQNEAPDQLTASATTGATLTWGSGGTTSAAAGGTATMTSAYGYISGQYGPGAILTSFTTTVPNVTLVSVDYTIAPYNAVSGLVLSLYNSSNTLIAKSSTASSASSGSSATKIPNIFNYVITAAGTYHIRASAGYGNSVGYDNPSYPITEPNGIVNIVNSGSNRFLNNLKFSFDAGAIAPTPSTTTTGTTNYTVTQTLGGCVSPVATIAVNVSTPPTTASAGSDQTGAATCGLTTVTLAGNAPTSGTGAWSIVSGAGGAITTPSSRTSTFTGTAGTAYVLKWTISNGCGSSSDNVSITFNRNPTTADAGPDQTGAATCGLTTVTLAANTPSVGTGSWSIVSGTGGVIVTPSSPTSTFKGVAGNSYTLRWTITNSPCTASTNDVVITFNQNTASATISYAGSPYCSGSAAAAVTRVGTAGGTYSSTTGLTIDPSTGTITPASSTPGTYTVTYSMTSGSCTNTASTQVVINALASATISYAGNPYCSSSGIATVTRTGTAGGTFSSSSGLVIDASTGDVTLASSTARTYTVTYTVPASNGCGAVTATTSITITTQPTVTGNYPGNPYCTNYGVAYPTGAKTGGDGTISAQTGLSINSSTGVVNLAASQPGDYTLYYTVPAGGGCDVYTATYNLVIIGSPNASISYTGSPYCPNAGVVSVTRTGTVGGVYSSTTGLSINASTGDINTNLSTPGTYTVTYKIAAAGSCAAFTTTTSMVITAPGTWKGTANSNWNVASNWQCGVVPTSTTNVIIPTGTPYYPIVSSGTIAIKNLTLQAGASVRFNNSTLQIGGTVTTTGGIITATTGSIEFTGTGTAQTIPAGLFTSNTIRDLIISNAAGVSLAGPLKVSSTVGFGNVNNSVLTSSGYLTLASTSSNSANLLDITNGGLNTGNTISGNVTVERYAMGRRAYRFLTAPVNSTTSIKANWMENVNNTAIGNNINPSSGYGTQITGTGGSANGFDVSSTNNPSMYTFNIATQSWTAATNTNGTFTAGNGVRIMVRGSRDVNLLDNNAAPSATTLRATGTLFTGTATFTKPGGGGTPGMPALSPDSNAYSYIANPYASSVNWGKIITNNFNDVSPTMYIFDPTISGSNNRGGYVAFNGKTNGKNIASSLLNADLQSGQGFFVQSKGPNPSITFRETYKSTTFLPVFRTVNPAHLGIELLLPDQVNSSGSADGTAVYFADDYSNTICDDDSYKFTNQDENIAILRNGITLSLEGRKPVNGSDSIPLKLWQLTQKSYTLKVTLDQFPDNVEAYLQDKYLNTATQFFNGVTAVPFTITSDAASSASNRFSVVFESLATLPVRLTGIKAYAKNKGVQIEWNAESESNMDLYEIESSTDARTFKTIASVKAKNNGGLSTPYFGFDVNPATGDNYYRIKSIEKSGETKESEVVRVQLAGGSNTISVINNPVRGSVINLLFDNVEKGNYLITLYSASGEKVYAGKIVHSGGSANQQVNLTSTVAGGIYTLNITNGSYVKAIKLLIQ